MARPASCVLQISKGKHTMIWDFTMKLCVAWYSRPDVEPVYSGETHAQTTKKIETIVSRHCLPSTNSSFCRYGSPQLRLSILLPLCPHLHQLQVRSLAGTQVTT